jgi:hypothetical protein
MGQFGHINCTFFSYKREIAHSGNLKWIVLSCNRNLAFQRQYTNHSVQLCQLCGIEWNMKAWWDDKMQNMVIAFWSFCYVLFARINWSPLQIKLSAILAVKWLFCFHNSSTEHYQYTSKAGVLKLSFWVCWHVMLLMCCRLQELRLYRCDRMTDRGLLEGIGSLQELTTLHLGGNHNLTAQALSAFLHRPSMTSIVSLDLYKCPNLDDEGVKGITERCNQLTYLHVSM